MYVFTQSKLCTTVQLRVCVCVCVCGMYLISLFSLNGSDPKRKKKKKKEPCNDAIVSLHSRAVLKKKCFIPVYTLYLEWHSYFEHVYGEASSHVCDHHTLAGRSKRELHRYCSRFHLVSFFALPSRCVLIDVE
jgi:hypothetical protein